MKRLISLVVILILVLTMHQTYASGMEIFYDDAWHTYEGNIMELMVNGEKVKGEMPPIIFSDRSLVPAREVFEALGAKVTWIADSEMVVVSYNTSTIKLIIDSRIARVNGEAVTMEIASKLINGKTMIPARFVGENLDMEVDFDSGTDTIIINNKKEPFEPATEETEKPSDAPNEDETQSDKEEVELSKLELLDVVISEEDKELLISLEAEKSIKTDDFLLTEPVRIVVDVLGASFDSIPQEEKIEKGNICGVRFGNQSSSARIVVDIEEDLGYDINIDENKIEIIVKMSSIEESKSDLLATAVYRKQGTIDYFESPFEIIDIDLIEKEKKLEITVNVGDKKGEDAAKKVDTLYSSALGYAQESEGVGIFTLSLKTTKISPSISGTKTLYIKSEIEPFAKSVMLDAGHGGSDPGAIYTNEDGKIEVMEKDLNLSVTLKVKEILEDEGVEVSLIRDNDIYVDFQKVGSISNSVGSTLFVSIHTNSVENPDINGVEVYGYLSGGAVINGMSSSQLSNNLLEAILDKTDAYSRGVRDGKNLAVIKTTSVPAALVEIGFITNKEEREKMITESYQEKLAQGIAEGILKSFEEMEIE